MPSVLDQSQSSADSRSGRAEGPSRYIFRYFNGHFAVTTPHLRETSVLSQPRCPPTQHLAMAPLFFHFFNGTTPTSWGDSANDFLLPQRLEDAHIVGDGRAAHVEHTADLGLGQLQPAGGGAGELHGGDYVHADAGGADRMALGLQPARDI